MPIIKLDFNVLPEVADVARAKVAQDRPWHNAVAKAYDWLMEQETVEIDDAGALLVPSASGGAVVYHANGTCECKAYVRDVPIPCWHRAAARLVQRMHEQITERERASSEQMRRTLIAMQEADDRRAAHVAALRHAA